MILATKITSERGKEITKTANEFIKIDITTYKKLLATLWIYADGSIDLINSSKVVLFKNNAVEIAETEECRSGEHYTEIERDGICNACLENE